MKLWHASSSVSGSPGYSIGYSTTVASETLCFYRVKHLKRKNFLMQTLWTRRLGALKLAVTSFHALTMAFAVYSTLVPTASGKLRNCPHWRVYVYG